MQPLVLFSVIALNAWFPQAQAQTPDEKMVKEATSESAAVAEEIVKEAPVIEYTTKKVDIINDKQVVIGQAVFADGPRGMLVNVDVKNLPAGKHGMHIHSKGTCEHNHDFKTASGHVNTMGAQHGFMNEGGYEDGDLPNLVVGDNGEAHAEFFVSNISISGIGASLADIDGSSLMIHAKPDDHKTQPIGGSGDRMACGVIAQAKAPAQAEGTDVPPPSSIEEEGPAEATADSEVEGDADADTEAEVKAETTKQKTE